MTQSWLEPVRGRGDLHPSTQILGITSVLYAYEDGTDRKFRNVGTKTLDAGRLPKKENTAVRNLITIVIRVESLEAVSDTEK